MTRSITAQRSAGLAQIWLDYCVTHTLTGADAIPPPLRRLVVELGADPTTAGIACAGLARLFPHARSAVVAAVRAKPRRSRMSP